MHKLGHIQQSSKPIHRKLESTQNVNGQICVYILSKAKNLHQIHNKNVSKRKIQPKKEGPEYITEDALINTNNECETRIAYLAII